MFTTIELEKLAERFMGSYFWEAEEIKTYSQLLDFVYDWLVEDCNHDPDEALQTSEDVGVIVGELAQQARS